MQKNTPRVLNRGVRKEFLHLCRVVFFENPQLIRGCLKPGLRIPLLIGGLACPGPISAPGGYYIGSAKSTPITNTAEVFIRVNPLRSYHAFPTQANVFDPKTGYFLVGLGKLYRTLIPKPRVSRLSTPTTSFAGRQTS